MRILKEKDKAESVRAQNRAQHIKKEHKVIMKKMARYKGEKDKPYAAFLEYCKTPVNQRTDSRISSITGSTRNSIKSWKGKFNWEERVKEWDDPILEEVHKAQTEYEVSKHAETWKAQDRALDIINTQGLDFLENTIQKGSKPKHWQAKVASLNMLMRITKYEEIPKRPEEETEEDYEKLFKKMMMMVEGYLTPDQIDQLVELMGSVEAKINEGKDQ